jgi:hypothetical protein
LGGLRLDASSLRFGVEQLMVKKVMIAKNEGGTHCGREVARPKPELLVVGAERRSREFYGEGSAL